VLTRPITDDLRRSYEEAGLWPNRALYQIIDEAATASPGKTAVVDPYHRLSYREFVRLTKQIAHCLLQLGVEPGDAVAIQAPNSVYLSLVHIAVNRVQGVYVPIHEQWREKEVRYLLAKSGARVLFSVDVNRGFDHLAMLDAIRPDVPQLAHVFALTIGPSGLDLLPGAGVDLDEAAELALAAIPVDADGPRHAMLSSGTTSMPKISEWSDNGLYAAFGRNYVDTGHLTADEVIVGVAPASTGATGYVYAALTPLLIGATSVLQDPWDPHEAIALLGAERATCLVAVPAQIVKMLESPKIVEAEFGSLRRISNGGAPLPESRARQAEQVFGCPVHSMYGTTDAGVPTSMDLDDPEFQRVSSVGRVVIGSELLIVDPRNLPVSNGEPGEVIWRGSHKFLGYMNDDSATRATFDDDGWYHSGDLGTLDDEGFLRIVGRQKDMILRGGQNIFPGEIEELLVSHPLVESAAVVGMADEVLGERTCAFIVPAGASAPPSFAEVVEFLRSAGLVTYKLPERLIVIDELPMSAGGKVQKATLTALLGSISPSVDQIRLPS
jgi:cyclohexanecarboxylate-CoA ligase